MMPLLETDIEGRRIGYARVSTADQKLRSQRDYLEAMKCDMIFEDHGVSGAKASRPGLNDALEELQPGDMLLVLKLDRLGRSVLHLTELLRHFNEHNVHFCSLSEGISTSTASGKMLYHIISAVAEFQRDLIVENTTCGIAAARKRGKAIGRPRLLSNRQALDAYRLMTRSRKPVSEVARRYGVSRMTLERAFERLELHVDEHLNFGPKIITEEMWRM